MSGNGNRQHILLSDVGANKPRVTRYQIGDSQCESHFSALALWKLLPNGQRPDQVRFLLTPEAEQAARNQIETEARNAGVPVEFIELPGNETPDDSRVLLERVAKTIPKGCRLTLDVTQGLRHHAFLFYALALYLSEFRDVHISGAWYCRWEISRDENIPRPFINLKPVLDLAHWFHALAVFRETGSLREIVHRVPDGDLRNLVSRLSLFFVNGMPLEAGDAASRVVKCADENQLVSDVPLAHELNDVLIKEIQPFAGSEFDANPACHERQKKRIALTDEELARQARFIDRYFETGQLNLAFGMLREWIVNKLARDGGKDSWLERPARQAIEHWLGGLGEVIKAKDPTDPKKKRYLHQSIRESLTDDQKTWGKRWNRVADIRNALQHHGMKAAVFEPQRSDIQSARIDWAKRAEWTGISQFGGGGGKLLICPIGLTPGVLYSALTQTKPDRAIVVCSRESKLDIDEAVSRAKSDADTLPLERGGVLPLEMNDIHRGVAEFPSLLDQASRWLFEADEIDACLTGGTTMMGVLVTRLTSRAAREYQRPVKQFVLIDPRTPEEQRSDPWQQGDIHFLDT